MLLRALETLGVAFASAASVSSTPIAPQSHHRHVARQLLGTNFGVPNENGTFDYVIVGGGNAGLTLAARLSEDPGVTVVVVEAGNFYELTNGNLSQLPADDVSWSAKSIKEINPLVDWGFTTTPQPGAFGEAVHYARGKALGGCTSRNYMAYERSTRQTYQKWADEIGDQSYTFDNISPYFQRSLNFTPPDNSKRGSNATPQYDTSTLGEGGYLDITFSNYAQGIATWIQKGMEAVGISPINGFTSGELIGSSWVIGTINHTLGVRESSETAFLRPALGRANLAIHIDTMAKKILFQGTTAIGVQVESSGYPYTLSANKEVIISAGTFQSPQLLMVSGIGPSSILDEHKIPVVVDSAGVGQNMWDHILFGPSYRVNVQTASALSYGDNIYAANEEFISQQDGLLASPGGDFLGYEKVPAALRRNFSTSTLRDLMSFPADWPEIEYLSVGAYFGYQETYLAGAPVDGYQYATLAAALVAPLSRGNISISTADNADQPLINPNWLSSPTDQQVAVAAYKRARQIFEAPVMRQNIDIGPEYFPGVNVTTDVDILNLIRQSFNTLSHATSTCKMGMRNDTHSVVDSQGRVYGADRLRVVDASIFPFLPPGLPMGTVYMLAEKIADNIRTQHG